MVLAGSTAIRPPQEIARARAAFQEHMARLQSGSSDLDAFRPAGIFTPRPDGVGAPLL